MKTDPTIDRIRKIRHAISVQCDHDPRKLVDYYMKYQEKYKERLIISQRLSTIRGGGSNPLIMHFPNNDRFENNNG